MLITLVQEIWTHSSVLQIVSDIVSFVKNEITCFPMNIEG